jgi:hypothetical protein
MSKDLIKWDTRVIVVVTHEDRMDNDDKKYFSQTWLPYFKR